MLSNEERQALESSSIPLAPLDKPPPVVHKTLKGYNIPDDVSTEAFIARTNMEK